jgi:N-acyl-L-homoserine lactone synthetase
LADYAQGDVVLQLITPNHMDEFLDELCAMHKLRYRVFKERLDWEVETISDMEVDQYDSLKPTYLIMRGFSGRVGGCVRFLPSTGPYMLRDTFPALLDGKQAPSATDIWESSRFALDLDHEIGEGIGAVANLTYELFAGMVEFGLSKGLTKIVTVTDARVERILRKCGWPLERLGKPRRYGNTTAVAGLLDVSYDARERLRRAGGIIAPVLWAPVETSAA